jgi:glycosyltransferase involved in cell wall biosynthesis
MAGQPLSVSEREIRELVGALPDPSKVVLRLGVIPDVEVDDYFAAADTVVLPYTNSFGGTSGVLMRATAAARHVVTTDVGDVGSIVRTYQLGIVVPAESPEALAAGLSLFLANRTQMAHDVATRALEYARKNGWGVMAGAVRSTYVRIDPSTD